MHRPKEIKRAMPCSLYDIPGIQNWLDEMALQGLFLNRISWENDRAYFLPGEPRPVRYRLDPVGKTPRDKERIAFYAQAGWEFVDVMLGHFYIFSCGDPSVPELHSDPQTLSYALGKLFRRQRKTDLLWLLLLTFSFAGLSLAIWKSLLRDLILWECPYGPLVYLLLLGLTLAFLVFVLLRRRRTRAILETLNLGLTLKPERRWNRPSFKTIYLLVLLPIYFLLGLSRSVSSAELYALDAVPYACPWPSPVQMEKSGPNRLGEHEPLLEGYVQHNSSYLAPEQELISFNQLSAGEDFPYHLTGTVRYIRTRSPGLAQVIFPLERDSQLNSLEALADYPPAHLRLTGLTPFVSRDHPALDRLETARYTRYRQEGWVFAALRGDEVLVVNYTGCARLEPCLELFLEALDKEATL